MRKEKELCSFLNYYFLLLLLFFIIFLHFSIAIYSSFFTMFLCCYPLSPSFLFSIGALTRLFTYVINVRETRKFKYLLWNLHSQTILISKM